MIYIQQGYRVKIVKVNLCVHNKLNGECAGLKVNRPLLGVSIGMLADLSTTRGHDRAKGRVLISIVQQCVSEYTHLHKDIAFMVHFVFVEKEISKKDALAA